MCFDPSGINVPRMGSQQVSCSDADACCTKKNWRVIEVHKGAVAMSPSLFTLSVNSYQPNTTITYGTLSTTTSSAGTYQLTLNCQQKLIAYVA